MNTNYDLKINNIINEELININLNDVKTQTYKKDFKMLCNIQKNINTFNYVKNNKFK